MTKGRERDTWTQALKRKILTEQNGPQKAVVEFVYYILWMEFQVKQICCQPCIGLWHKKAKNLTPSFQTPTASKETRVKKGEMGIRIINNEVNQIESTTKLSWSVVLDDHSYCWQKDTPKCLACVDKKNLIEVLVNEMNELALENQLLKRKTLCYANSNRSCFRWCNY